MPHTVKGGKGNGWGVTAKGESPAEKKGKKRKV